MTKTMLCFIIAALTACGYSSTGNALEGQVKKLVHRTPIVCPDYMEADISLGVMRNGVGSLSKEDVLLAVDLADAASITTLKSAAKSGAIVTIGYDVPRISPCWPDHRLRSVAIEQAEAR